jgi:hypothetical protein
MTSGIDLRRIHSETNKKKAVALRNERKGISRNKRKELNMSKKDKPESNS